MLDREQKGYALERGHLHLHPAWLQLRAADGQIIYASTMPPYGITTDFVTAPVGGTCGGDCNSPPCMSTLHVCDMADWQRGVLPKPGTEKQKLQLGCSCCTSMKSVHTAFALFLSQRQRNCALQAEADCEVRARCLLQAFCATRWVWARPWRP